MRVVLDTNILVSASRSNRGALYQLWVVDANEFSEGEWQPICADFEAFLAAVPSAEPLPEDALEPAN